ncbi:MAG: hypothetical protein MUF31_11015, partial [Akkermansiaceae bacterium]|nr:hypothetical protein [Akkermansiaceae bacterium]
AGWVLISAVWRAGFCREGVKADIAARGGARTGLGRRCFGKADIRYLLRIAPLFGGSKNMFRRTTLKLDGGAEFGLVALHDRVFEGENPVVLA